MPSPFVTAWPSRITSTRGGTASPPILTQGDSPLPCSTSSDSGHSLSRSPERPRRTPAESLLRGIGAGWLSLRPWAGRRGYARGMRPTLYEFAGGEQAFLKLAAAHHARCLADPELNHPFSHPDQNPRHVERLAAYWAQVTGGPPAYAQEWGRDQAGLVPMPAGNRDMSHLGRPFVAGLRLAA